MTKQTLLDDLTPQVIQDNARKDFRGKTALVAWGQGVKQHFTVVNRTELSPPGSPDDNAFYLLPDTGTLTGDWSAFANKSLAVYQEGSWTEITPEHGWFVYILNEKRRLRFDGTDWTEPGALLDGGTVAASSGVIAVKAAGRYQLTASDSITGVIGLFDGESCQITAPATGSATLVDGGSPATGQAFALSSADKTITSSDETVYTLTRVGTEIRLSGGGGVTYVKTLQENASPATNTANLQAAIDDDANFRLIGNDYEVNGKSTITTGAISMIGQSPVRAAFKADGKQSGITQTADDTITLEVQRGNFTAHWINFSNSGVSSTPMILAQRPDGAGDIDIKFVDCNFEGDAPAGAEGQDNPSLRVHGRGIGIFGGYFENGTSDGVQITWDGLTEADNGDTKGPTLGMRSYVHRFPHIHAASKTLLRNESANAANSSAILIHDGLWDVGGEVIEGVARQAGFNGNLVQWSNSAPYKLKGGSKTAIIGSNMISGSRDVASRRPNEAIRFDIAAATTVEEVVICGLAAGWTDGDLIEILGENQSTSIIERLVITGVSADQIGKIAGASYFLHASLCTIRQLVIEASAFKYAPENTATVALRFDNVTLGDYPKISISPPDGVGLVNGANLALAGYERNGVAIDTNGNIVIRRTNEKAITVGPGNEVSIGNIDPTRKLTVYEDAANLAAFIRDSAGGGGAGVTFGKLNDALEIWEGAAQYMVPEDNTDGSEDAYFSWHLMRAGALAERMRLLNGSDGSGTLGIGTGAGTDPDLALDLARPVGFPVYTVATAPSPATLREGAQAHFSDGAAGVSNPAFVDGGNNWRRYDTRALISAS